MEIGLAILLFLCMTALLYVVLSLKITRQVDLQIKEFYKTRIHQDMQEFYREMEGYAALFENRIQRFRLLVERNEAAVKEFDGVVEAEPVVEVAPAPVAPAVKARKKEPVKPAKIATKAVKGKPVKAAPQKKVAAKPVAPQLKPTTSPVKQAPAERPAPVVRAIPPEADDAVIAEELIKDLFLKEETESRQEKRPPPKVVEKVARPVEPVAQAEGSQVVSFFSKLGKAIEPVIFGEKPGSAPQARAAELAQPRAVPAAPIAQKPGTSVSTDFSEVLRRAEQIKAEKKAERERAEIEARAEFYAGGDSFDAAQVRPKPAEVARPVSAAVQETVTTAPRRNTLAVKELDKHTINFLIDSLVTDNGYRRQALRALTENNIPLDEIARLSKIDIGELELMRQLGRF